MLLRGAICAAVVTEPLDVSAPSTITPEIVRVGSGLVRGGMGGGGVARFAWDAAIQDLLLKIWPIRPWIAAPKPARNDG